jgi:catechol 2,3-dioxygenase-like lactoylglutathione lyase family enzyme
VKYACALIVVEDMARSRRFYEGALGQEVEADFGENVGYKGGFSIMRRALWEKLLPGRAIVVKTHDHELYFEDDDVMGVQARLEAAGVEFLHKATEQPWRQLVLRCYDPDGHMLEVGETMLHMTKKLTQEGMDAKAICAATGMSEAMALAHLKELGRSHD